MLKLDGKSGAVRLKLNFKPDYVTRSRQGSSTFSGTFAVPGKIVGAPVKGVGALGGGVLKGASFLRHGLGRKHKDGSNGDSSSFIDAPEDDGVPVSNATDGETKGEVLEERPATATATTPGNSTPATPIAIHKRAP